jgi:hypothetical protein
MLIEKVTEMIITATSRKSEMVTSLVNCTHLLFVNELTLKFFTTLPSTDKV